MLLTIALLLGECLILWTLATLAFDVVHFCLHRASLSRWKPLRLVGSLHESHHQWWDTELQYHDELWFKSFLLHRIPEYLTQIAILGVFLTFASPIAVGLVALFSTILLVGVLLMKGKDLGHKTMENLPSPNNLFLVELVYHSYHHRYPEYYLGSFLTLLDKVLGTGAKIKGQRVTMTGSHGALGGALAQRLCREGVQSLNVLKYGVDFHYDDYTAAEAILSKTDILILAHGSKDESMNDANCNSFVELIELYRRVTSHRRFAPEVWAVGSEAECHPAWGNLRQKIYSESKRAFATHAHRYYRDRTLLYRHIVPSAFNSKMGKGLMSADFVAKAAIFSIKRGFRYIPVTYTGIAFLNYFKFLKKTTNEF